MIMQRVAAAGAASVPAGPVPRPPAWCRRCSWYSGPADLVPAVLLVFRKRGGIRGTLGDLKLV